MASSSRRSAMCAKESAMAVAVAANSGSKRSRVAVSQMAPSNSISPGHRIGLGGVAVPVPANEFRVRSRFRLLRDRWGFFLFF